MNTQNHIRRNDAPAAAQAEEGRQAPRFGAPTINAVGTLVSPIEAKSDGFAKGRVAIDTTDKDRDSGEYKKTGTFFADIAVYGKQAVADLPQNKKGDKFIVRNGQFKIESYDDKEGQKRDATVIKVFSIGSDGNLEIQPRAEKVANGQRKAAPAVASGPRNRSFGPTQSAEGEEAPF